jgi:Putative Flp pilus-assembly TadE/G-like
VTRVNKPSNKMVTPNLAAPTLERTAAPKAGFARLTTTSRFADLFRKDESGSTAMMFSLMIMPVMFLTGMAVDYSRMITVKQRMQTAIDAAALAGVRAQQGVASATNAYQTTATTYYNAITQAMPFVVTTKLNTAAVANNSNTYTWTADTWVRTPFLSIAQMIDKSGSAADAPTTPYNCTGSKWKCQKVSTTASILASVGCDLASGANCYSIETSFMLDITGSMGGQSLTDMKNAAKNAINILVWTDQSQQTSKVAVVPFSADVRMPTVQAYEAATGRTAVNATKQVYGYNFGASAANLCTGERQGADRYLDTAPSSSSRPIATWKYINNNPVTSATCVIDSSAAVQPLTNDKTVLNNLINSLDAGGSTAGHIGTMWAWYMLSPNFKHLWDTANQPGNYDTNYNINTGVGDLSKQKLKKFAVLMTDGDYNTEYTSNGILDSYFGESPANDTASKQATETCTNMKAKGIEVFTVAFAHDSGLGTSAQNVLKNCATKLPGVANDTSHYYLATDGNALNNAFKDIALKISRIRVSG